MAKFEAAGLEDRLLGLYRTSLAAALIPARSSDLALNPLITLVCI